VTKALGVLVNDELLARGDRGYDFDDPFFRAWVLRATASDLAPLPATRASRR
jgi:hypothetical protein